MKPARALLAAVLALGTAVVVQLSTSSSASAHDTARQVCGNCWHNQVR